MVIWGIADTPNVEPSAIGWGGRPRGAGTKIPGLGLPVVTASEPACAGTPEQGLSTGVDSPVTPGVGGLPDASPGKPANCSRDRRLRQPEGLARRRKQGPMG